MAKKKQPAITQPDAVLEKALKRFSESWDYAKGNWHDKWDRDNKLYDNERAMAEYVGVTNTSVPMAYSTIETLVSALNNANLRFDYRSGDPMKRVNAAPLNGLIDEYWDDGGWDSLLEMIYRDTTITGIVPVMMSWNADEDRPEMDAMAARDAVIDPTLKQPRDLQRKGAYAGRRFYVRKGTLDDEHIIDSDPDSKTYGEQVQRYKLPKSPIKAGQQEPDDKELKERFSGSTLKTAKDDQDELIEIWDIDRVVTLLNRSAVIEDRVNPHKKRHELILKRRYTDEVEQRRLAGDFNSSQEVEINGELVEDNSIDQESYAKALDDAEKKAKREARGIVPMFFMRNLRRLSLIYSKGEIDAIAKPMEHLNDLTNMESDALIRSLAPQRELDPEYEDWLDLIDNQPDTVYPFKPGSLRVIDQNHIPPNAFNNRMNIKNEIRETTAIDQVAKGIQNIKQASATEVNTQMRQTNQRIESKARIFEKDGFHWMGWILLKLVQLYVDKPLIVEAPEANQDPQEIMEKYGIELPAGAAIFDPEDYRDDWRPRVSLEIDAQNKQVDEMRSARESFGIIIQDPTNNLDAAKRILYPKMFNIDRTDLDEIMTPAEQGPGMAAPMEAGQEADPAAQGDPTNDTGIAVSQEMMADLMDAQAAQGGAGADAALVEAVNA